MGRNVLGTAIPRNRIQKFREISLPLIIYIPQPGKSVLFCIKDNEERRTLLWYMSLL